VSTLIQARSLQSADSGRPGWPRLLADQVGYAVRELWRSRVVLIFTFVLPLVWLLLIGILAGNEAIYETSGVRLMQFVTPTAAVMGVLFATYPPVANSLALAREQKILKRLRGTPLPPWAYLTGRVGGSVLLALSAVAVMLVIGVVAYDVQIIVRTVLASVVSLVVGIAALTALGLAVGAVARTATVAQAFAMASGIVLTFISGMFTLGGEPPAWLDRLGWVFPVRHLASALQDQFNPFLAGSGWDFGALATIAAWGLAAMLVAIWALRREPSTSQAAPSTSARSAASLGLRATRPGRPSPADLILDQTRWANRGVWRDLGSVFFAIIMPIGLYALFTAMYGDVDFRPAGMDFTFFFACGMTAYGIAVTAFINMPEVVAMARDRGVLKRLRGTPLAPLHYLVGRTASVLWIALLTAILVFTTGVMFFDASISVAGLPLGLLVVLVGTLTLAACGYALAAVAPNSKTVTAVGLGILLPLSFFSDVFMIGNMPEWMGTIGSLFPLRHFVHGLASALNPAGVSVGWDNFAVMSAWLVVAAVVAVRWFRWEPKR
jgi:ABC-type multidrug transport system permease subunit